MKSTLRRVHIDSNIYVYKRICEDSCKNIVFKPGTKLRWLTVYGYKPSEVKAAIIEQIKTINHE